jgi:hypothetical protein
MKAVTAAAADVLLRSYILILLAYLDLKKIKITIYDNLVRKTFSGEKKFLSFSSSEWEKSHAIFWTTLTIESD